LRYKIIQPAVNPECICLKTKTMKRSTTIPSLQAASAFVWLIALFFMTSCSYYKVMTYAGGDLSETPPELEERKLFLHSSTKVYHIEHLSLEGEGKEAILKMDLAEAVYDKDLKAEAARQGLSAVVFHYPPGKNKRYHQSQTPELTKEVHLYLAQAYEGLLSDTVMVNIPARGIMSVRVIKKDRAKTVFAAVGSVVGGAAAAIFLFMLAMMIAYAM
jgi:hypothetical protein